jgi:hypothetical protein
LPSLLRIERRKEERKEGERWICWPTPVLFLLFLLPTNKVKVFGIVECQSHLEFEI